MALRIPERTEQQPSFDRAIMAISQAARNELAVKFANRPYHNLGHAKTVDKRSNNLLKLMSPNLIEPISAREFGLAHIIALSHDIIQPDEIGERRGISAERLSAEWLNAKMDEQKDESGRPVFTQDDKDVVLEAIMATTPLFLPNGKLRQPFLSKATSPITVAIALADLYGVGLDGAESHIQDSRTLFQERFAEDIAKNTPAANKILLDGWIIRQLDFVKYRREMLRQNLDTIDETVLPKSVKDAIVAKCANNFTESGDITQRLISRSSTLNFDETMELLSDWRKI